MALETPNLVQASALLLIEGFEDPPNSTITFATNNGFKSVAFLDIDNPDIGITLEMDQPVNNMEGSVYMNGDVLSALNADSDGGYISPLHQQVGEPFIDDVPDNQVVIVGINAGSDVFRMNVLVVAQLALAEAPAGEPVPEP